MNGERVEVPCGTCTACCKKGAIILHPEHGDDPAKFQTTIRKHPITGEPAHFVNHKANGECIYLGDTGCTIHATAPHICTTFDCRRAFLNAPRLMAKFGVGKDDLDRRVMKAGRRRLHTLPKEER